MRAFIFVCALAVAVPTSIGFANDNTPSSIIPTDGIDEFAVSMVMAIEAVGRSDVGTAADLLFAYTDKPENPAACSEAKAKLRETLRPFETAAAEFESVDLVGATRVSSAAYTLSFVGNGKGGPVLFQLNAYHYQRQWKLEGISFHYGWSNVSEKLGKGLFATPINYRLEQAAESVVGKSNDSANPRR